MIGAGKTTIIKCVLGLVKPTAGRITVCGRDVRKQLGSKNKCPLEIEIYCRTDKLE